MFIIEVINHVIVAVLLEIRVFHLRLMLLYRGIILLSVRERYYGTIIDKTLLLVAGPVCFVFQVFLAGARHLEIVRLGQWSKHKYRLEIRNDWQDILECIWCEGFQHRECTKISADVCNALSSVIDNIVFFVLPVYNYFQLQ